MPKFSPFANESESLVVGNLTIENRTDRVTLYGDLDLTRDRQGLRDAQALRSLLDEIVGTLEADPALPDRLPPGEPTDTALNPFK